MPVVDVLRPQEHVQTVDEDDVAVLVVLVVVAVVAFVAVDSVAEG